MAILDSTLSIALAAAPWLLLGLFAAGLIKAFVPDSAIRRWVGGRGLRGISQAAVVGAPLPLCSCGAIPTALALHRGGAGRGPTTAFMIGTPGIGVDSLAITYALLGPFMMVARAAGAVATAIGTGLLVASTDRLPAASQEHSAAEACCGSSACQSDVGPDQGSTPASLTGRLRGGMRYAFGDLLDDISIWIAVGVILAGVLIAFVPPETLTNVGSGLLPMLVMAFIGIPLYICATAATPIAAGMLMAGVSPGTVLVFLLAGPITSMATLGVLRREMGNRALLCYLLGIASATVVIGLLTDQVVARAGLDVIGQIGEAGELLPYWLKVAALVILVLLSVRPARRAMGRLAGT